MGLHRFLNKVIWGDCLKLLVDLPDCSVDMVLCDLPYGVTKCKWDTPIDLDKLWVQYRRVCKPNAAILLFAQLPFDKVLGCSNLHMLRYEWIWYKTKVTGHFNAKKMPMKAHENILVFYKKLPLYNPIVTIGHKPVNNYTKTVDTANRTQIYGLSSKEVRGGGNTTRLPKTVIKFSSDLQFNNLYPTQKPLALCKYLIETYTNPGMTVLDNCCGSGTVGQACIETGRDFILMDNSIKAVYVAKKRLSL